MSVAVTASEVDALLRDERHERRARLGLAIPAVAIILLVLVLPILGMFGLSFVGTDGQLSLENYARIFADPSFPQIMRTTFTIALWCTALCILLGYPVAYLLAELPPRIANLLLIAVLLPFWTSLLVRTYSMLLLLQRRGVVNDVLVSTGLIDQPLRLAHNMTGTVIGMTHVMLPYLILPLYASFRAMDRSYLNAAAGLGASPVRTFWTISFPLSLPGLVAGSFLVFVLCLGFYVTPAILGGGRVVMIAQAIQTYMSLYANWGAASALGVVLFSCTTILLFAFRSLSALRGRLSARVG